MREDLSLLADLEWGIELPLPQVLPDAGRNPTVANWVEEFKRSYFSRLAPASQIVFERELREFALFIGTRKLTPNLVMQFCNERKRSGRHPNTLVRLFGTVKRFLRWCENMGYVDKIAFLVIPGYIIQSPPLRFSLEQYCALKEATKGTIWYSASVMAYRTGMRFSDVSTVKWENVDLEQLVITYIPFKARRKNRVAVCPVESGSDLHEVLLDLNKSRSTHPIWSAYVCPDLAMYYPKDGGMTWRCTFSPRWAEILSTIGAGHLSFHKLRNSFMSRLVDADLSWPKACQITGLSTFSVFLRYAKPDVAALRKDMEKLSRMEAQQMASSTKLLTQGINDNPIPRCIAGS